MCRGVDEKNSETSPLFKISFKKKDGHNFCNDNCSTLVSSEDNIVEYCDILDLNILIPPAENALFLLFEKGGANAGIAVPNCFSFVFK